MKITNEAKKLLEEALAEQDADGIRFHTSRSCCGTSLRLETVKITAGDEPEDINGLVITESTKRKKILMQLIEILLMLIRGLAVNMIFLTAKLT